LSFEAFFLISIFKFGFSRLTLPLTSDYISLAYIEETVASISVSVSVFISSASVSFPLSVWPAELERAMEEDTSILMVVFLPFLTLLTRGEAVARSGD
jgi:ABC-type spermidine/putrescine transport system permease subunit I